MKKVNALYFFVLVMILEVINILCFSVDTEKTNIVVEIFYLLKNFLPSILGLILCLKIKKMEDRNRLKIWGTVVMVYRAVDFVSGILLVLHFPVLLLFLFFSCVWLISVLNIPNISAGTILYLIEVVVFWLACQLLSMEISRKIKDSNE